MSQQMPARMEAFVAEELQEFSEYLLQQAGERLRRRNIVADRHLLQSLATQAAREQMSLSFASHGRFHDMGAGRGYRKGIYIGNDTSRPHPGHKPSKWYSRLAWGAVYGTLVNNLANKYVAEVATDLKHSLSHGHTAD